MNHQRDNRNTVIIIVFNNIQHGIQPMQRTNTPYHPQENDERRPHVVLLLLTVHSTVFLQKLCKCQKEPKLAHMHCVTMHAMQGQATTMPCQWPHSHFSAPVWKLPHALRSSTIMCSISSGTLLSNSTLHWQQAWLESAHVMTSKPNI